MAQNIKIKYAFVGRIWELKYPSILTNRKDAFRQLPFAANTIMHIVFLTSLKLVISTIERMGSYDVQQIDIKII